MKGRAPIGRVTVLTVQHMWEPTDRDTRWGLKRNSLGVFNEVQLAPSVELPLCAAHAPPVEPFIQPTSGQTLGDLRDELGGNFQARLPMLGPKWLETDQASAEPDLPSLRRW